MDSKEQSSSPENADTKAKFRKPSSEASGRKYRRHSPVDESSSPDDSPLGDRPSSPTNAKEDSSKFRNGVRRKVNEKDLYKDFGRSRSGKDHDSYRYPGQHSPRISHSYSRNSEHGRHESGNGKSKDYDRDVDRYGREKDENNGYRSRGREKESFSPEYYKDREDISRGYESRRKKNDVEELGRDGREHDNGDRGERKDRSRISRGHTDGGNRTHSRGEQKESSFRSDSDGYHHKDASNLKRDSHSRLAAEKVRTDKWDSKNKDLKSKGTEPYSDDATVRKDSDNASMKKQRMFGSTEDPTPDDNNQMKESHEASEIADSSLAPTNVPNAAADLNAAKFAAMKAAEMVNKNLAGGFGPMGHMSTEQKKKLLWGNKKSTATEESGSHWDVSLIADRERQEKFHKLMSLRLPWCIWPIVGCEGRGQGRVETQRPGWQQPPEGGEAEGTAAGLGETVHRRPPTARRSDCRFGSLRWFGCILGVIIGPFVFGTMFVH